MGGLDCRTEPDRPSRRPANDRKGPSGARLAFGTMTSDGVAAKRV